MCFYGRLARFCDELVDYYPVDAAGLSDSLGIAACEAFSLVNAHVRRYTSYYERAVSEIFDIIAHANKIAEPFSAY